MAGWRSRVKDGLTSIGLIELSKNALWAYRYHRDRLTGAFTMNPVQVPGLRPGPHEVEVRLAAITSVSRLFVWGRYYRSALICSGNWDERIKHRRAVLSEVPAADDGDLGAYAHRTVIDMFVHGLPYQETAEYQHLAQRIRRGGAPRGCRTLEQLDGYFRRLLTDDDAVARGEFGRRNQDGRLVPFPVHVFVDRDGGVIHVGQGSHQLRMAERHGLERVPARLLAVHDQWALPLLADRPGAAPIAVLRDAVSVLAANGHGP